MVWSSRTLPNQPRFDRNKSFWNHGQIFHRVDYETFLSYSQIHHAFLVFVRRNWFSHKSHVSTEKSIFSRERARDPRLHGEHLHMYVIKKSSALVPAINLYINRNSSNSNNSSSNISSNRSTTHTQKHVSRSSNTTYFYTMWQTHKHSLNLHSIMIMFLLCYWPNAGFKH